MQEKSWLLVTRSPKKLKKPSLYGSNPYRSYYKPYPTRQPKALVVPQWTNIDVLDNTVNTNRVKPYTKLEIVPKSSTRISRTIISTEEVGGEPYDVKFSTEDTYYPTREIEPDILEEFISVTSTTDTVYSTGAAPITWDSTLFHVRRGTGILKHRILPLTQVSGIDKSKSYKEIEYCAKSTSRINRYRQRKIREYKQLRRLQSTTVYLLHENYIKSLLDPENITETGSYLQSINPNPYGPYVIPPTETVTTSRWPRKHIHYFN